MSTRRPPRPARTKVRRDVDITRVLVAIVYGGTAVVLAYLFVVWRIAEQGLDVRGLVSVRLGPREWGYLSGFIVATTGLLALLLRNGRIEKLLGRDIPAQVQVSMAADRDATARAAADAAVLAVQPTAPAPVDPLADRTLADVARVLAAALLESLEYGPPIAEEHEDVVVGLLTTLQRQPAAPLPPLPPMAPARRAHRAPTRPMPTPGTSSS